MSISTDINMQALAEILLLANTPNYIYKHFRNNDAIGGLITKFSLDELITEYNERTARTDKSLDDIVISYAILVALTFLDYSNALKAMETLDLSLITWGDEIKDIFASTAKPVTVHKLQAPLSNKPFTLTTISHSSQSSAKITYTPKGEHHD